MKFEGENEREAGGEQACGWGVAIGVRESFSFGTVNNSLCLSWSAFHSPLCVPELPEERRRGPGSCWPSRVFTAMGKAPH